VGEEQPTGWAYHLPDALGSVRQLTDTEASVTLARFYEPFGSVMASSGPGETNYSFTGEWADGTGLMHLRARYYAPWQGRFITKDSWEGETRIPISYNKWLYAEDNSVNHVDPSGLYASDTHWLLTQNTAQWVGAYYCRGTACALINEISRWIADADQGVDEGILAPVPGRAPELHFKNLGVALRNAWAATSFGDPTLFGASLHMIQDYYSHYYEGYRYPEGNGHLWPSLRAGCIPGLGCHRHSDLIFLFYWQFPDAKDDLRRYYPGENLNAISDDKLIDLWLYTFTEPGDFLRGASGSGYRYGYDTDHNFGFTDRDQMMISDTIFFMREFFQGIDDCEAKKWLMGYDPPSKEYIKKFLETGVVHAWWKDDSNKEPVKKN
jgi:RHS repeat-associated protein